MKCAVILAGCGQYDGSETHETILTLLALSEEGISWDGFAPDVMQKTVVNHVTQKPEADEQRSVLKESARLVRGRIQAITRANVADYDMVIFPGGFGAMQNLCDWAKKQQDFTFQDDVQEFIEQAVELKKPMGFICIAPMMLTKIYPGVVMTIGNDAKLAEQVTAMGLKHQNCKATAAVVDKKYKVVCTPANMLGPSLHEMHQGIHALVKELKHMVG